MKIAKRNTAKRIPSVRIESPETRKNRETGKKELLLSYIDERSNLQSLPTTKELFLYAAGDNSEGQLPDGLDRLSHHRFIIHVDADGVAIGLDIIPARVYRSRVIPVSQKDITTVRLEWELDGAVCRVTQRPPNTKADRIEPIIRAIDALVASGKSITTSTKLNGLGKIVVADADAIEVKLSAVKTTGGSVYDIDAEDDEE